MDDAIEAMLKEERARLDAALPRIVEGLVARGATLVVLFGSEARGRRHPLADLDILAVVPCLDPFVERLARFYQELKPGVALDLIVYTPEEFGYMRERPFVRHILEEGRVLHAA